MKRIIYIILLIFTTLNVFSDNTGKVNSSLSGKITNEKGETLIGATIYFPEMKTGTTTDDKGTYKIGNLPNTQLLIQISAVGYKTITENIGLEQTNVRNFSLEESVVEINEVVVTGQNTAIQALKTPSPVSIVSHTKLKQNSYSNIIDALSQQPGVSQITTGSGISKPVIRGLGYNRVVVMNDGIRQEGQQWGDEHGIEMDEYGVDRVEILKGPASLVYGSDAMAGVINMISAPVLPEGKMKLNILGEYQTNNGLTGFSANFAGHKSSFIWDARLSLKQAHSYQNKYDGYVYNSGYNEQSFSALAGINKYWGYSHLILSSYHLTPGIVEGERDSLTGKFLKPTLDNNGDETEVVATNPDMKSYDHQMPYQQIYHYKAVWNNNIFIGNGSLKSTIGYQQNRRQEFEDVAHPDQYGLYFKLHTINYSLNYQLPNDKLFDLSFGANGMYQKSLNMGTEFLIPSYRLFDYGLYAIASKTIDKLYINGGIRFDQRHINSDALYLNDDALSNASDPGASERFRAFSKNFQGASGSIGLSYKISETLNTKINFSSGFRAPNISELSANGVHEGTIRYELGNLNLKQENSFQVDYELSYNTKHISASVNLFSNIISNYIFSRKLNNTQGGDSIIDGYDCFVFDSGKARLFGGEFSLDIHPHPLDWLHIENNFSYVNSQITNQPDSMRYLPFTPAPKWNFILKTDIKRVSQNIRNGYVSFGLEHDFRQNHIYSAFSTETETPAYTLLNAGLGFDVTDRKNNTLFSLVISGTNLADVAYQNHLSRLKYAGENLVNGRTGVYNMGRNFTAKLIIPVDF